MAFGNNDDLVFSYRGMASGVHLLAQARPILLNDVFEGVRMPSDGFMNDVVIPPELDIILNDQGKRGYKHFVGNPLGWTRLVDQRRFLTNIAELTGDESNIFDMGRYINNQPGFDKVKNLMLLLGAGPYKSFKLGLQKITKKFNLFLLLSVLDGGENDVEVEIKYKNPEEVHPLGDLFTLGSITAGLESFYEVLNGITIQSKISPFEYEREAAKEKILGSKDKISYIAEGCEIRPKEGIHVYNFRWYRPKMNLREKIADRIRVILGNYLERHELTRVGARELQLQRSAEVLSDEIDRADDATRDALHSKLDAAEAKAAEQAARADAAEAKLTLEEQVRDVNKTFGEIRTLAHDDKNHGLALNADAVNLLKETLKEYPEYKLPDPQMFKSNEDVLAGIDKILMACNETPQGGDVPKCVRIAARHAKRTIEKVNELIENERAIMSGGMPVTIVDVGYSSLMDPVVDSIKRVYPQVEIDYDTPEEMVLQGDVRLLKAAFTNLVSNAVEASLPDGHIEISQRQLRRGQRDFTLIDIHQSGDLSEEIAARLNAGESFTTKEEGNATGAAASYNIIRGPHNGSIQYTGLGEKGGDVRVII